MSRIHFDEHDEGGRTVFVRRDPPRTIPTIEEALREENRELVRQLGDAVRARDDATQKLREIRAIVVDRSER